MCHNVILPIIKALIRPPPGTPGLLATKQMGLVIWKVISRTFSQLPVHPDSTYVGARILH